MSERELDFGATTVVIDREPPVKPVWLECTERQWEKKGDLCLKSGKLGEALKYADYANCRALYEDGCTITQIQGRFNHLAEDD